MSMDRTQVWREVVLEMPWYVETCFNKEILIQWQRNFVLLARERGGFILFFFPHFYFSFSQFFLFLNFFLYSSSNYCVTKMYQIHQKWRIIVGCHLLGWGRCVFLWPCFLSFLMQLESVCSIDCCRGRERGEEYSCNKMKVTTACRSISNIPWPCVAFGKSYWFVY